MTKVEYDGDNPLRLANEIEAALAKYGSGSDHHMCKAIHFFEGELRLIAECLRCAGPPKVANQPPSTHGVATEEIVQLSLPGTLSAWKSAGIGIGPSPLGPVPIEGGRDSDHPPPPPAGLQAASQAI